MLKTLLEAFALISTWEVIISMLAASVYGLVIGSLPGLSATMATALLVPVTFYLSPIAAIATIVAASGRPRRPGWRLFAGQCWNCGSVSMAATDRAVT